MILSNAFYIKLSENLVTAANFVLINPNIGHTTFWNIGINGNPFVKHACAMNALRSACKDYSIAQGPKRIEILKK